MRLIDRLRIENNDPVPNPITIVADDVAAMYWQDTDNAFDEEKDFGVLRAPFPSLWIEWRMPSKIFANGEWMLKDVDEAGCYVHEMTTKQLQENGFATGIDPKVSRGLLLFAYLRTGKTTWRSDHDELALIVDIDEAGRFISHRALCKPHRAADPAILLAMNAMRPAMLALSLMNCKNVSREDVAPDKLAMSRHCRRYGFPLTRYSKIVLPRTNGSYSQRKVAAGERVSLSLVRGHFKTYTEEAPLLGQHVGTFWWNWQARGDAKNGTVIPTYEISPDANGQPLSEQAS